MSDFDAHFAKQISKKPPTRSEPTPTLRDQFAMAALNALGAAFSREWSNPNDYQINVMAKGAYIVADAMLAAREAK